MSSSVPGAVHRAMIKTDMVSILTEINSKYLLKLWKGQ